MTVPEKDLSQLRVLVTRPLPQAEPWCERLRELGIKALTVPVLALNPVTDEAQRQAIKNVVLDFDVYQKAIFVSQNAVDFAMQWLEDYWPQLPQGIRYFAVGETTAARCRHHGLTVSALETANRGDMNSESLLQAAELQQVRGEKIVIFRGCGGRGKMAEVLRSRGAQVTYCELYQRRIPIQAQAQLRAFFMDPETWQSHLVIALHSGESLEHFVSVLLALTQDPTFAPAQCVLQLPVLVPGERVTELAKAKGFAKVITAENATDKAMTAALLAWCHH